MNRRIKIDKEWLYKKYVDEKLNTYQIANLINCDNSTIGRYLNKFNIPKRSSIENKNIDACWNNIDNKDYLIQKYIIEKKSTVQIAKECNCSSTLINKRLKEFDIQTRDRYTCNNTSIRQDLLNDKQFLEDEYLTKNKTTKEISIKCNCSDVLVCKKLREFNINKPYIKTRNKNVNYELLNNKEWLTQKYVNELQTPEQISSIIKCSKKTIMKKLKEFNIELRDVYTSQNPDMNTKLLHNKKWLKQKYVIEKLSSLIIANICNCSEQTVLKTLNRFNIPTRKTIGENHPNWKGGISFEPYCNKFNNQLKEQIRDKFDRKCFLCGKREKDSKSKLHVHHTDYNKGQGCGYNWSLIPLCRSCHMKTNSNRYYWFNLLNNYWCYKYLSSYSF